MRLTTKLMVSVALFPILLSACAPREYNMDSSMGVAVHESLAAQIVNTQAVPSTGPQGLDGAPSKAVMDRYVSSFMTPPPPVNAFSIGIGSGGGSMATPATSGATP